MSHPSSSPEEVVRLIAERDALVQHANALDDRIAGLIAELDEAGRERDSARDANGVIEKARGEWGAYAASLEARLNEAREALEPFIWSTVPIDPDGTYSVVVRGSDILRGRATLASISDTEGGDDVTPE